MCSTLFHLNCWPEFPTSCGWTCLFGPTGAHLGLLSLARRITNPCGILVPIHGLLVPWASSPMVRSAPVKRLVTRTLSRPAPVSISSASMLKLGLDIHPELLFRMGTETEFLLCCKFESIIFYWSNLSTMSTIPDHSNVENNSPTVTDHSSNLASISECLAVLDRELSMIPTLRASLATSLSSSMVIKGRPCCGPYFLVHTFKRPVLIFNL